MIDLVESAPSQMTYGDYTKSLYYHIKSTFYTF